MGYRSTVKIMLEDKAYKMVMDSIKRYNEKPENKNYIFKPDSNKSNSDEIHLLTFEYVKWYSDYEDVKSVESVLSELDKKDVDSLDGYRYKMIELGEDNNTEEYTNDFKWTEGYDLFVECNISEPDGFKEI